MNCRWIQVDDPSGLRTYYCPRKGCKTKNKLIRIPNTSRRLEPAKCYGRPEWHEFGSWLSLLLGIFWITPESVGLLLWLLGFKKKRSKCRRCGEREAALNTLGSRFNQALAWLTGYNTP
jgi:hypothetical protein